MLLYDYRPAPSPRRVRIFLAEKGVELPIRQIDLGKGEQFAADYRAQNPRCTVPALVLDDGTCIWDTLAICEYLDALHPQPPLLGATPLERAAVVMWYQRVELDGFLQVADVFRNASPAFKDRALFGPLPAAQIPQLVDRGRPRVQQFYRDMDARLTASKFLAGDFFSLADIQLLCVLDFAAGWGRMPIPDDLTALLAWKQAIDARPGSKA